MFSSAVLLGLLGMFGLVSSATVKVYLKQRVAVSKNEEMKRRVEELEKRKEKMKEEVEYLQSDFGREEEIRSKFNAQKPGEKVLVIVDAKEENDKAEQGEKTSGFFLGIWEMVKNIF